MRLKSVKLTNFRGYRDTTVIPIDGSMTGIVGRNDFGKSTILEALAIFFEADGAKADKNDINCFRLEAGESNFEITCVFDELPDSLILDENVQTTLADELLLNSEGCVEVVKVFKATTTGKPDKTYIRCQHPVDKDLHNMLGLKINDLKKLGKDRGIEEVVADKRVASFWRKAIRDGSQPLELAETLLDVDKGLSTEGKSVWTKIQDQLPTFALFKADRESSDGDSEAKNPLQQAVKDAQATLQEQISSLEEQIEQSVLDVADRTLEKLREMAPELAKELKPRFKDKPKWTFNFTLDGEDGIPINKRGSGVRRLILLNFFRAEAEKTVVGSNRNVIYAIEEPETSQHPNYQIMLMKALLELANQDNRQILVTTHVPALAGLIPIEGIRYVTRGPEGSPIVKMPSDTVLKEAAESLGVLPETGMERARGVVLVEGKSDVTFLRHTTTTLKDAGHIAASLDDAGIVPLQTGGSGNVKHWVTHKLADDLGLPWCVFLDSDVGGSPEQAKSIQKRKAEVEAQGRAFYSTRKREIENYLCKDLIKDESGAEVTFTDTCDAKKIIGNAVGMKPDDVIERFWPSMCAIKIIEQSTYEDSGVTRSELVELSERITALVD
ncbi:putative ATP-dependent endonuclease of OLD family [Marinimicrobium koreense]|uniref:Putative ATP-dependent endonuclease of OLD family n=1 Tax=Marinimicrobium koreense TaxID=306545 RepID=A0A3N1NK25_9GAMM|nr:AAA family ATPase [Marinimicrobium koreense]ROQ20164.1 putative ATP-dependent endonuclease of OLD family [Marinimicrobium koreense]